jgi:hypothetical protein
LEGDKGTLKEIIFEELPEPLIHLGSFTGRLARLQGLSLLGLGGVTLDGRDADPEGAGRLGLGHAPLYGVHDLPTEVFGVRFHRPMIPCGPSSSQHAVKERRLNYIAVTITGLGQKVNRHGKREYSVPKQDLVSALEVPFHKGTLKVAKGLEGWPKLREELLNFRRKQNTRTAHISYEHWRESDHDDLVLAAALACWKATYKRNGTTKLRVIR